MSFKNFVHNAVSKAERGDFSDLPLLTYTTLLFCEKAREFYNQLSLDDHIKILDVLSDKDAHVLFVAIDRAATIGDERLVFPLSAIEYDDYLQHWKVMQKRKPHLEDFSDAFMKAVEEVSTLLEEEKPCTQNK